MSCERSDQGCSPECWLGGDGRYLGSWKSSLVAGWVCPGLVWSGFEGCVMMRCDAVWLDSRERGPRLKILDDSRPVHVVYR